MSSPIERLEVAVYEVPTDVPLEADGTLSWAATTLVAVTAYADGHTGLGWTYASGACAELIRGPLHSACTGVPAMDVPRALEQMVRACRNLGRPGLVSCAISAVETALFDLKGRMLGVSLADLLGTALPAIPIYGSGGFTTYDQDQTAEQVRSWVGVHQLNKIKIKIGEDWGSRPDRDIERVALVRELVGPEVEVFVDANGGYTRKQAIRQAHAFAEHRVNWFEEPVSSDDLAGLREIRDAVTCDVAAGEYGYDTPYFLRMCAAGAVDCLQVDVTRCGGFLEWQRAAAIAAAYGLQVSGHCAPGLHAQVAGSAPNLRHLEWFHDHVRVEEMLLDGTLAPVNGALVPDRSQPGHGFSVSGRAEGYRTG